MARIAKPLTEILDISEHLEIVRVIWRRDFHDLEELRHYESYLKYYRDQMKLLQWGNIEEDHIINCMASKSHGELLQIVTRLSNHRNQTYADIQGEIQLLFPRSTNLEVKQSIDLALRIWLMLNVRDANLQLHTPKTPRLQWTRDNLTLVSFVAAQFPDTSNYQLSESYLDPSFTAAFLHRACDVVFEPTSCLADHLRLDITRSPGRKYCRIFSFRNCVVDHLEAAGQALADVVPQSPVLPAQVLQETLWSFNQLFPPDNEDTKDFLSKVSHDLVDASLEFNDYKPEYNHRPSDLNEYKHWRGRIDELRRLYVGEPETLREFAYKKVGFERKFTFIGTIVFGFFLAVVFGVISSVTAIVSTKATLQALALQKAQPNCVTLCK